MAPSQHHKGGLCSTTWAWQGRKCWKTFDPYQNWFSSKKKCWKKFWLLELMVTLMQILCEIHTRHSIKTALMKVHNDIVTALDQQSSADWSIGFIRFWCHWPRHTVPTPDCIIWFSWQWIEPFLHRRKCVTIVSIKSDSRMLPFGVGVFFSKSDY